MKKIINDDYVIKAHAKGINNITPLEMSNCYHYITGRKMEGSCSKCVWRNAWKTMVVYILPIIKRRKNKE